MPLLTVLLVLFCAGVLLWGIGALGIVDGAILKLIRVVTIVVLCLWLASLFGLFGPLEHIRVGK